MLQTWKATWIDELCFCWRMVKRAGKAKHSKAVALLCFAFPARFTILQQKQKSGWFRKFG